MTTKINVRLEEKKHFYSKFSKERISEDLAKFIYDECNGENYKNHVVINIYCKEKLSDNEKHKMMDNIRRTYGLLVQDEIYYSDINQNKKAILLLLGIALIILYYSSVINILREIILILGWLSIWESVYSLIFDTRKDFVRIIRLKELAKARIYFVDSEKELDKVL